MKLNGCLCLVPAFAMLTCTVGAQSERGFVTLFDGKSLAGWQYVGPQEGAYVVKDGAIVCPPNGRGDLYTEREFSDFVLRLDYRVSPGGNNGIGVRTPLGKPGEQMAFSAVEIQILDDSAPKHANVKDWQRNGSLYGLVPAKEGAPKIGEWNACEITCVGRDYKVKLNGKTIVDGDLNHVGDAAVIQRHPGLFRERGRIALLGHNSLTEFRNIRIRELARNQKDNTPPKGFAALFNGKDLTGWKGLVASPLKRAAMSKEELAAGQAKADGLMREGWKVENGTIAYRGNGFDNLCARSDYGDFELLLDWKIEPKSDSGIYLRGTPQVQIWDNPEGSGALWNNKNNASKPLKVADKPVGEWNTFRIVMVGEKVHVFLNHELVVNNTTLENFWERDKPLYPTGQIELQAHKTPVWFKNIYVREIPRQAGK